MISGDSLCYTRYEIGKYSVFVSWKGESAMDFEFQISPYAGPSLVQQVSRALEKRTELRARAQFPKL